MTDHVVEVKSAGDFDAIFIVIVCSCGETLAENCRAISLDELAQLADEHITGAELAVGELEENGDRRPVGP